MGDVVEYELNKDGSGVINNILPRKNYLSRKVPKLKGAGTRGERLEQIIAANVDNLIVVASWRNPEFNNRLLDRLILAGESAHINVIIVINKSDLKDPDLGKYWVDLYTEIGYTVYETSVKQDYGLDRVKSALSGSVNLLWGQSGVGKSSLLNRIYPQLNLKTGEISSSTSKGKHTTVTSVLIKIEEDTYIIDTPGIREIDPYGIRKEDVGHFFAEFLPHLNNCRFNTCTHHHEPGCSVIDSVEKGIIKPERYKSYLNIIDTIEDDMNF